MASGGPDPARPLLDPRGRGRDDRGRARLADERVEGRQVRLDQLPPPRELFVGAGGQLVEHRLRLPGRAGVGPVERAGLEAKLRRIRENSYKTVSQAPTA